VLRQKKDISAADIVRTYMYFLYLQLTAWMTVCESEDRAAGCSKNEKKNEGETIFSKNIPQIKENRKETYELDETYCRHDIPKPFIPL